MITKQTVFILGAGASTEYGFPLGAALVQQLIKDTSRNENLGQQLLAAQFRGNDIDEFREKLKFSDSSSIDTFLEGNEDKLVEIGRAAIALTILVKENGCTESQSLVGNPPEDHWLRYVWNLMRSGCSRDNFPENKVAFVTFNYDRTVEQYFDIVLQNSFNMSQNETPELRDLAIPIIHLHGEPTGRRFGDYSYPLSGEDVRSVASGIRIVHDPVAEGDPNFAKAHELISQASVVCLLGFGYHPTNIERLKLKELRRGSNAPPVFGSIYLMEEAEIGVAKSRLAIALNYGGIQSVEYKAGRFLRAVVPLV